MDDGAGNLATDLIESGCSRSTANARLNMVYVCPNVRRVTSFVDGRLEVRAAGGMEWSGRAAFKERDNAGRHGWIVDERFQNSCVGGCEFSDCRVQLSVSFWARQADPKT